MNETQQTVEMRLAYAWDCENCGAEHFERAIIYELSPEEIAELREAGEETPVTGNWVSNPTHVKCDKCGAEFEAKHFRADDDLVIE